MKLDVLRQVLSDYDKSTNADYPFWAPFYNAVGKNIEPDDPLISKLRLLLDDASKKGEKNIRHETIIWEICLERNQIVNRLYMQSEYKNIKSHKGYKLTSFLLDHLISEIYEELKSNDSCPLDLDSVKSVLDYLCPYGKFTSTNVNDVILYASNVASVAVHDEIYKTYGLPSVYKRKPDKIIDMKSVIEEAQIQFMPQSSSYP